MTIITYILRHRIITLLATFIVCMLIAIFITKFREGIIYFLFLESSSKPVLKPFLEPVLKPDDKELFNIIFRGLLYSIPPLPLFFILWVFRNYDTKENLTTQQETLITQRETLDIQNQSLDTQRETSIAQRETLDIQKATSQQIHENKLSDIRNRIIQLNDSAKKIAIEELHELLTQAPELKAKIYSTLESGLKKNSNWDKKLSLNIKIFDDLQSLSFESADLKHEDLQDTGLRGANLQHADLRHANFSGADLRGADSKKSSPARITPELINLKDAIYDDKTTFTDGETGYGIMQQNKNKHEMIYVDDLTDEELKKLNARYSTFV